MQLATTHGIALANLLKATSSLSGATKPILKYKKGDWVAGPNGDKMPLGTQVAANVLEARKGLIRWVGGAPAERLMVLMTSGMEPPPRETLGHLDKDLWEPNNQGVPSDPWQWTLELPVREIEGELREFLISGTSAGFEKAFKNILSAFCRQSPANPGKVPIVELGSGSFKHKKWGDVPMPTLTIVRWVRAVDLPGGGDDQGDGDDFVDEDLNDDVPF